jgi:hypothetical protein
MPSQEEKPKIPPTPPQNRQIKEGNVPKKPSQLEQGSKGTKK